MGNNLTGNALAVDRAQISSIYPHIREYIRKTPVLALSGSDFGLEEVPLLLKLELFQQTGSFKARGAITNLLLRKVPPAGVVAASGGNHGVAVAFAAHRFQVPARIFVPTICSPAKQKRIRSYGAQLEIAGERYADALEASNAWVQKSGAIALHAFDQRETLLGQGTVGLELEEQAPNLETLLVAVGGGGLIGGIAAWFTGKIKIIGIEPELSPTLFRALAAGRPVDAEAGGIAADSLAPRRVGELMFPIAKKFVERVILVPDEAIREAQQMLWETARVAAEPGGATALAALTTRKYVPAAGERVGVLVCGGNTTAVDFDR
ncbi:MAG TPA: threonine/serine dehydratase [Candidatus Acidoferrum sp.]|nr:threonine/serine dehydratase [Candidatus Acidoferrum sp.]